MIAALVAMFLAAMGLIFSSHPGGHGHHHQSTQTNKTLSGKTDSASGKTDSASGKTDSAAVASTKGTTAVPTPALLPGLIGLGVATFRKRRANKDEAKV